MIVMYVVLITLIIIHSYEKIRFRTHFYMFYLLTIVCCLVALVLIKQDWLLRRDRTMLLLTLIVNALTIAQI
jgi:hypothetical protein